jgi:hypothetical protein
MSTSIVKSNGIYYIQYNSELFSLTAALTLIAGSLLTLLLIAFFGPKALVVAIITIIVTLIIAYEVNCFEVGSCTSLAWIYSLSFILVVFASTYFIHMNYVQSTALLDQVNSQLYALVGKVKRIGRTKV